MNLLGRARQATTVGNRRNQPQIGKVITHEFVLIETWLQIFPIVLPINRVFNSDHAQFELQLQP